MFLDLSRKTSSFILTISDNNPDKFVKSFIIKLFSLTMPLEQLKALTTKSSAWSPLGLNTATPLSCNSSVTSCNWMIEIKDTWIKLHHSLLHPEHYYFSYTSRFLQPATWVSCNTVPMWLLQVGVPLRVLWGYSAAIGLTVAPPIITASEYPDSTLKGTLTCSSHSGTA